MLAQSIIEGLRVLARPAIWIGALAVIALLILLLLGASTAARKTNSGFLGCVTLLVGGFLPGVLSAVYFAFVLPIVFGGPAIAPASTVADHAGRVVYAGIAAGTLGMLIGFVPIWAPVRTAFSTFAQGVLITRFLFDSPFRAAAGLPQIAIHLPTFGLLIAYLAIACLLGAIVGVPTWIQRRRRPAVPVDAAEAPKARRPPPTTAEWIAGTVGAVAGYLPTFMYLEYLRLGGS